MRTNGLWTFFLIGTIGFLILIFSTGRYPKDPVLGFSGETETEFKRWFFTNYQEGGRDFYLPIDECNITVQCAIFAEFLDSKKIHVQPFFVEETGNWDYVISDKHRGTGKYLNRNEAMVYAIMKSDSLLNNK